MLNFVYALFLAPKNLKQLFKKLTHIPLFSYPLVNNNIQTQLSWQNLSYVYIKTGTMLSLSTALRAAQIFPIAGFC